MIRTALAFVFVGSISSPGAASCLDLSKQPEISVSGKLSRPIFPGPPGYEDVRKGDTPEPAYILTLSSSFCVAGDDFLEDDTIIHRVQLIGQGGLLAKLVGQHVEVAGSNLFGAHTGHHHAALLMTVTLARSLEQPANAVSAGTSVEAFYLALEFGDGAAAAENVIPEKRAEGPLSAKALSNFYGSLKRPLKLLGVTPLTANTFRALYTFETRNGRSCKGSSVVTTKQVRGLNLIAGIKAETGC